MNVIKAVVLGAVIVAAGCASTPRQTIACTPRGGGAQVRAPDGSIAQGGSCECRVNVEDALREDCEYIGTEQVSRADPR